MALHTDTINGSHFVVGYYDPSATTPAWTVLAKGTSHSISYTVNTREVSNKSTCKNRVLASARQEWNFSADAMNAYDGGGFTEMLKIAKKGLPIYVVGQPNETCTTDDDFGTSVGDRDLVEVVYGEVLITDLSGEFPDQDNSTMSVTFDGTGELLITTFGALPVDPTA